MEKLKYYTLNKEEKIKLKEEFYHTEYGLNLKNRLNRLLTTGILGIVFSIILFIFNTNKWDIIYGIILAIASLIFIYSSYQVRISKINNYLTRKKK